MQISTFVDVVSSIISDICEAEMMVIHPPRVEWLPARSKVNVSSWLVFLFVLQRDGLPVAVLHGVEKCCTCVC